MTPEETAAACAGAVSAIPSHFMLAMETYARGGELGFDGIDFYVVGRGGVLGPVDADVVSAGLVYLEPDMVRSSWDRALGVMDPAAGAAAFIAEGHAWAREHLPEELDAERLAELAGRAVTSASPAGAPLFAAWRRAPEPEDPRALAFHRLNVLRELQGALHAVAVLAAGIAPLEAVLVGSPFMAAIYGWPEPHPDVEHLREAHEDASARGLALMGSVAYSALEESERVELVTLAAKAQTTA